jgi:hypothetical protein
MSQTCPSCGKPAAGRFCGECGVALDAECRDCGSRLPAGARFCNQCGRPVAASADAAPAARTGGNAAWIVAGVLALALAAALAYPHVRGDAEVPTGSTSTSSAVAPAAAGPFAGGAASGAAGGNPRAIDVANMDPREAADRLFNRVMQAVSSGDTAQARAFLPMSIAAYGRVDSLDVDGHYHLGILQLVAGDGKAARAEADTILATNPNHLFGLFTAAQAERALGNRTQAVAFYKRFLASYDAETKRALPEYKEHDQALPPMRTEAQKEAGR